MSSMAGFDPTPLPEDARLSSAKSVPGVLMRVVGSWPELVAGVGDLLDRHPLPDPCQQEIVVVPGSGQRRHLSHDLARRLGSPDGQGVCAGLAFASFRDLRYRLQRELIDIDPERDPWRQRGLALAVLDVMDAAAGETWFKPVERHLRAEQVGRGLREGRPMSTAIRIARLLQGYWQSRPDMLRAWSAGGQSGPDGSDLGMNAWQAEFWRRLTLSLVVLDPIARHDAVVAALETGVPSGLPPRLLLADPHAASQMDRELIAAVGRQLSVHIWLICRTPADPDLGFARRFAASERAALSHWRQVASVTAVPPASLSASRALVPPQALLHPHTLLHLVQSDCRAGRVVPGCSRDRSVQVHSCHGIDRQVEVLREVLCGLFQDDPTLEPRDVLIACTNVAAYAPAIEAAFCLDPASLSLTAAHPGFGLRVQLAASTMSRPNDLLGVLRWLLTLGNGRATSFDLLDLCSSPAVAARFGFDDEDRIAIRRLLAASAVSWGIDRRQRAASGLPASRQGTWLSGIERMCVSVAFAPEPPGHLETALGIGAVDSGDLALIGKLAELVSRVRRALLTFDRPAPIPEWMERLRAVLDDLTEAPNGESWQLAEAHALLSEIADASTQARRLLSAADVRTLLDQVVTPHTGRPSFANGSIVVADLGDLDAIEHRVTCVVGLDDRFFPPLRPPGGDDVLARVIDPAQDPRRRGRQHLLNCMLATTDTFVIIHQGRDERTNEELPVPVAVLELLELCASHLDTGSRSSASTRPSGAETTSGIVHRHSLQPYSVENFDRSSALPGEPGRAFSFDAAALAGARSLLRAPRQAVMMPGQGVRLQGPRLTDLAGPVELQRLVDFYKHPARELLRHCLGGSMTSRADNLSDELPIELNGLSEWQVGERLLGRLVEGVPLAEAELAERMGGSVPPGKLGHRAMEKVLRNVSQVNERIVQIRRADARDLDVSLDLDGRVLMGRVHSFGDTILVSGYGRPNAGQLVQAWLQLLLVAAQSEDHVAAAARWKAAVIGRAEPIWLQAPPSAIAARLLGELLEVRCIGLTQLVPLPPRTGAALAGVLPRGSGPDRLREAKSAWGREHDDDWQPLVGADWEALRAVNADLPQAPLGATPRDVAASGVERLVEWFWTPVAQAIGGAR